MTDKDGVVVGKVADLVVDDQEKKVRFLLVEHGGFLGFGDDRAHHASVYNHYGNTPPWSHGYVSPPPLKFMNPPATGHHALEDTPALTFDMRR